VLVDVSGSTSFSRNATEEDGGGAVICNRGDSPLLVHPSPPTQRPVVEASERENLFSGLTFEGEPYSKTELTCTPMPELDGID